MKTNFLPISIEVCHENTIDSLMIEGELQYDFGPWKKGHKCILNFNFDKGTVEEVDNEGEVIKDCEFHLEPNK